MQESEIQSDVVQNLELLKKQLRNFEYFSIPNEGLFMGSVGKSERERYKIYQKMLKMGFKSGVPDLCILGIGGKIFFIELKNETGRVSPKQKIRIGLFEKLGYKTYICRSAHEVAKIVMSYFGS